MYLHTDEDIQKGGQGQEEKAKGGGREGKGKAVKRTYAAGFLLWLKKIMNIFHFIPLACLYLLFFSNKYEWLL